jgi:hypothetical protein
VTHPRKLVRDAFAIAVTGLGLTGTRVHKARRYPLTELPALRVFTPGDERGDDALADQVLPAMRVVDVVCEACAQSTGAVEDTVDAICEQAEAALELNPTLGGVAQMTVYQDSAVVIDDSSEQPIVIARMRYRVAI